MGCLEWMVQVHRHLRCWFSSASSRCGATTQQLWPTCGRSLVFFWMFKMMDAKRIYRGGRFWSISWTIILSHVALLVCDKSGSDFVLGNDVNLEGSVCRECFFFLIEKTTRESETERFASLFIGFLKAFWSQLDINTHSSELFRIRSRFFMFFLFGFLSMFLAMFFPEMFWPSHDS